MCTREICPCAPIDVKKWHPYEKALLLGSRPDRRIKPRAYIPTVRRDFYFKPDGFVQTFGQCYDIYSKRNKYLSMTPSLKKTMEVIEVNLNC